MSDTRRKMLLDKLLGIRGRGGQVGKPHICSICKDVIGGLIIGGQYTMEQENALGGLILGGGDYGGKYGGRFGDRIMKEARYRAMDKKKYDRDNKYARKKMGGLPMGGYLVGGGQPGRRLKQRRKLSDWQKFLKYGVKSAEMKLRKKKAPSEFKHIMKHMSAVWTKAGKDLAKAKKML